MAGIKGPEAIWDPANNINDWAIVAGLHQHGFLDTLHRVGRAGSGVISGGSSD